MPVTPGGGPVDSFGDSKVTIATGMSGLDHWLATVRAALFPAPTTQAVSAGVQQQVVTLGSLAQAGPSLPQIRAVVCDLYSNVGPAGRNATSVTLQFQDSSTGATVTISYPYPIALSIAPGAVQRLIFPTTKGVGTTPIVQVYYTTAPSTGSIVVATQFLDSDLPLLPVDYHWSAPFATVATTPGTQLLAAPAPQVGTLRLFVTDIEVTNAGTADSAFLLTNGSGGTTLWESNVVHAGAPVVAHLSGNDELVLSPNTALYGVAASSSATMIGTITGRYGV